MGIRKGISKFGHSQNIQIADLPIDICDYGKNLYPFQDEPLTLHMASTDDTDTAPILVEGLNENGIIVQRTKALTGQTPVPLDGQWLRQYRGFNNDTGNPFVGTVYVSKSNSFTDGVPDDGDDIVVKIEPEHQQTLMAVYTTPRNWYSKIKQIELAILPKTTAAAWAVIGLFTRKPGKCFTCQKFEGLITTGTSSIVIPTPEMGEFPPFTDFVMRALEISANGIELKGAFDIEFSRQISI